MRIRLQGPGHAAGLLAELNRCRQSRQYCDVFLQVGNRTFSAHRAVLACAGSYFRNLFTRAPATSSAAFSLEFISPANFERVLTFVYTGEILTDLIDVGVLYELAERLGVNELMKACHSTFPDLQASVSVKAGSPGELDSGMVSAAAAASTGVSASSVCSSAASCSSLSSSAGPSAAPTPAAAPPSPLFQPRPSREAHTGTASLHLKAEDMDSHIGYGQISADLPGGHSLLTSSQSSEDVLPPVLQLKMEQGVEEEEAEGSCEDADGRRVSESAGSSLPHRNHAASSDSCSFPDSSSQIGAEAPSSLSSGDPLRDPLRDPLSGLQVGPVEGSVVELQRDGRLMLFGEVEEGEQREALKGSMEGTEEEQWRQLAGEIIELSDDENFMEDGEEEEEDEDDLVYVENGEGSQGLCRVCGASFPDRPAGLAHSHSHVGVQLFTFLQPEQTAASPPADGPSYTIPQGALTSRGEGPGAELQCASVRDHLLSHVCPQSLSCGVCRLPQLSLCSLLWHGLAHLSLPVFSCPHCALCFVQRCMLDRHMAAHAEEAAAKERERLALRAFRVGSDGDGDGGTAGVEELHCFLCPQSFRSTSAFQYHLGLHSTEAPGGGGGVPGWFGKRKADQPLECLASSSSQREVVKMSNLGLGMSFNLPDKFFQGSLHSLPSGVLTNGGAGQDMGVGAAGMVASHMELHKDHLPLDFNIEQTFMYNDHSKEPLPTLFFFMIQHRTGWCWRYLTCVASPGLPLLRWERWSQLPAGSRLHLWVTGSARQHVAARLVPLQKIHMDVLQQRQEQGEHPKASAEHPAAAAQHREEGGKRGPGQGQIALCGHEGQEEGAAVEVDRVDEVGHLAEEASPQPDPVNGHLHHEERHGHHHHEVRQAHVEDAEQDPVGRVASAPVDPDDQHVLQQAHHEDEKVDEEEGDAPVVSDRIQVDGAVDEP
ncbi:hypothetical protein F7725_001099 [Dissostichus mawsoni]|uniref:Uncharacterized protein n=1 Tax=Dissostichus mawsoni TaxID=36200 RepID=A0A7J5ZGA2_DISMA|nr:hypothetical protein F7725_001099 [Dissostichus mawsoni]